ncbi:MAG: hypothetical protein JOZ24_08030, partial [Candidatus Eremiobacteraeota bacterium]|nr:hypothetical protein [Candidatus Eremiobacteraeota bacterium]
MGSDLLFYESADAYVEYYTVRNGYVAMNRAETWDGTWTHIVPGHFDLSGNQQFVCYDAVTGAVELATVVPTPQGGGGTIFGQKLIGWQPGYDILVAGRFENAGGTDQLLCYSRAMGAGETFQVEADEYPLRLSRLDGWRTSWTNIVPGSFGGQGIAGLLFYDAANRTGEFYAVDAGALTLLQNYTDWRTSWNGIVAGDFGGGGSTNLLFYDAAARTGEFYRVDGGAISLMKTNTDWRSSWVTIVAGNFSGGPHDDLLFYDRGSGTGEFWRVNRGDVTLVRSHTDW